MFVDEVPSRVREVAAVAWDGEAAHSLEDSLWCNLLEAIAAGSEAPPAMAHEALTTRDLDISRWYA